MFAKSSIGLGNHSTRLDEKHESKISSGAGRLLENLEGQVPGSDLEASGPPGGEAKPDERPVTRKRDRTSCDNDHQQIAKLAVHTPCRRAAAGMARPLDEGDADD